MSNKKRTTTETETILIMLDQVSQTIEVMNSLVGRLRSHFQEPDAGARNDRGSKQSAIEVHANRTLH